MKIVVDTSLLIDKLRGLKKWDEFLEGVDKDSELFLPMIVVFELFSGQSSKETSVVKKINNLSGFFQGVDLTWDIARRAGEIYRGGVTDLQIPDYIIAATALELGAQVVTLNVKHFSKIPGLLIYPL